mmetsp:Transcript_4949/g.10869  ORF Transcript_4949/g.10869 Transcript_4949/m.10869 type:complete len:447 (-) Transcript_4949:261-1601(-)
MGLLLAGILIGAAFADANLVDGISRDLSVDVSLKDGRPYFDWEHVQVWTQRGRRKSSLTVDDMEFVKKYPIAMYTTTKTTNQEGAPEYRHALEKMKVDLGNVKRAKKETPCFAYLNSATSFPAYEGIWCKLKPNETTLYLKNRMDKIIKREYSCQGGSEYKNISLPVFNFNSDVTRDTFVNYSASIAAAGFDGIFLDRADTSCRKGYVCTSRWIGKNRSFKTKKEAYEWDSNHVQAIQDVQKKHFPKRIAVSNNVDIDGVVARQHEKWAIQEWHMLPSQAIDSMLNSGKNGVVIQAFANPCSHDNVTISMVKGTQKYTGRFMRINTLAMFLISMCKYSYYSCALGFVPDYNWLEKQPGNEHLGMDNEQLWAGNHWWPEYNERLGTPKGLPNKKRYNGGYMYYREFESSVTNLTTKVYVHIKKQKMWSSSRGKYDITSVIAWGKWYY